MVGQSLIKHVCGSADWLFNFLIAELEINIKFPTCWDGINTEAKDGNKHVVYAEECDGKEHNECFDFDCPTSHPVKLPELHLYVRVLEYEGGAHVFADGTDVSSDLQVKFVSLYNLIIPLM